MISKAYLVTSAVIFALVAISHFIRLVNHSSIVIGTATFPFWGSWLAVILASTLSIVLSIKSELFPLTIM
jgi:glycine/serine hydroxymethyltransferase